MPPGFRLPPAARHQPPCCAASRWHGSLEAPKRLLSWPPWVLILLLSAITFFFTLTVSTLPTVNIQKRTNVFHLCLFNRTCVRIITFWILPLGQVHVLCYITEHKTNYILRFTHFVCCSHRVFFFTSSSASNTIISRNSSSNILLSGTRPLMSHHAPWHNLLMQLTCLSHSPPCYVSLLFPSPIALLLSTPDTPPSSAAVQKLGVLLPQCFCCTWRTWDWMLGRWGHLCGRIKA